MSDLNIVKQKWLPNCCRYSGHLILFNRGYRDLMSASVFAVSLASLLYILFQMKTAKREVPFWSMFPVAPV